MTWDKDDPRWTAYVLGELEGDDVKELHAVLDANEDARHYVESLRETASLLSDELRDAEPLALTDLQRQRIANEANAPRPNRTRWLAVGVAISAAAAVLLIVVLGPGQGNEAKRAEPVATTSRPQLAEPPDAPGLYKRERLSARARAKERAKIALKCDPADPLCGIGDGTDSTRRRPTSPARGINTWDALGSDRRSGRDDPTGALTLTTKPPAARVTVDGDPARGRLNGQVDDPVHDTETYDHVEENDFVRVADDPLSTFSIDVDTASYANVRRYLTQGMLPPAGSVRIEEMINYFSYDYSGDADPFSARADLAEAPWNREHRLLRIGIKGKEVVGDRRPRANLVFLIDVSGSMNSPDKLPLLKKAMRMLVSRLDEEDEVAIVVYAGASGLVLPPTAASKGPAIERALDELSSGGSTNGGAGIELAYATATDNFIKNGVNRVILATDGDFNVGTTSQSELVDLIEKQAKSGVFLTVLGFGMGNYKDSTLEKLADRGNGNYAYIDTINEARKVLVEQLHSTMVTIAKDVKIQIEFNPARVASYRLIGYENRVLAHQDFNDDTKDAGEIGAGHTVTALYEIVPAGRKVKGASKVDDLKYQAGRVLTESAASDELVTIKLRFKRPNGTKSTRREFVVRDRLQRLSNTDADFRFAAAVAAFGMILRDSQHKGSANLNMVLDLAEDAIGDDPFGYRLEFVSLVKKARRLAD